MDHGLPPATDRDLLLSSLVQAGEDTTYTPCACEACRSTAADRRARCRALLRRLQGSTLGEGPPVHLALFVGEAPAPPRTHDDTLTLGYATVGRILNENEQLKGHVTALQRRLSQQLDAFRDAAVEASVLRPRSPLGAPAWLDEKIDAVAAEQESLFEDKRAERLGRLRGLAWVRSTLAPAAQPHPKLSAWHTPGRY